MDCFLTIPQSKIEDFCQPPLHKGALHSWRIVLRVYVLCEEQRAMPAYEEPPVLNRTSKIGQ